MVRGHGRGQAGYVSVRRLVAQRSPEPLNRRAEARILQAESMDPMVDEPRRKL
jgi:hypothetical protein